MIRYYISAVLFLSIIVHCSGPATYIDYTGQIEQGGYWYTVIDASFGTGLSMDFRVLNSALVDIIFTDQQGFREFQDRICFDTLLNEYYDLYPESYDADFFFLYQDEVIVFTYSWAIDSLIPVPVDVFVMDHDNYNNFIQNLYYEYIVFYDSITAVHDTLEIPVDDYIYFIIDNTILHGSPPSGRIFYEFIAGKLIPSDFRYFKDISFLNYDTISTDFQAPAADTLYLIINNSGYIEGGAVPENTAHFEVMIQDQ
jgi:hypothetical protein